MPKKRLFSDIQVPDPNNLLKVVDWLNDVHRPAIMATGHFDNVLVFPKDQASEVLVILIAKSVEEADVYEIGERPEMKKQFKEALIDTNLVGIIKASTSTEK